MGANEAVTAERRLAGPSSDSECTRAARRSRRRNSARIGNLSLAATLTYGRLFWLMVSQGSDEINLLSSEGPRVYKGTHPGDQNGNPG